VISLHFFFIIFPPSHSDNVRHISAISSALTLAVNEDFRGIAIQVIFLRLMLFLVSEKEKSAEKSSGRMSTCGFFIAIIWR
jgi:hypothetical protein